MTITETSLDGAGRGRGALGSTRHGLTFKLETRSAVSKSVNWLIWSTIPTILGFTAASVELCRLVTRCWKKEPAIRVLVDARSWRAQHWAAYRLDIAILIGSVVVSRREWWAIRSRFTTQIELSWTSGDFLRVLKSPRALAALIGMDHQ